MEPHRRRGVNSEGGEVNKLCKTKHQFFDVGMKSTKHWNVPNAVLTLWEGLKVDC